MKLAGEHKRLVIDCKKYILVITDSGSGLVMCGYQKNIVDWDGRAPSFRAEHPNKAVRGPIFPAEKIMARNKRFNYPYKDRTHL